ncbi:MAG TPA: VWA domain-containing protein, partial [Pyrinomonadaceae bacterium]
MKKIAVALLCFGLFSLSVFAQSGRQSRPRIVTNPTPNDSQNNSTQNSDSTTQTKRPPVLIGDSKKTGAPPTDSTEGAVEDDEVIRVETNLVTIPVSVLDRNGRFISGLKQSDFQISEDGVPQKIEYFAPVEQPFTVVLLFDVSPSTAFKIDEIHDAAITFVNQLRPEDRVMVIAFDQQIHILSRATNNRSVLYNAIRQSNFGDGTSLYEAVDVAINRELRQIQGRKAVVLFTDGVDTTSRMANYQSTIRHSEETDAMIYPIRYDTSAEMQGRAGGGNYPSGGNSGGGVLGTILGGIFGGGNVRIGGGSSGGNGSSRNEYEVGRRYLEDLARTSGGRAFEARSLYNLDAAFSGIAEELRRQYSIGYYPETVGQMGQRKQIKVRTNRADAVVRAKNSY